MIQEIKFQAGDIFLVNSQRLSAKIVRFLMAAPTVWHYIWRKIHGTQQHVRYYHAGMFITPFLIIEQQSKVQTALASKLFDRTVIIYRKKILPLAEQALLSTRAVADIGQGYDVPLIIGKTLTWLTGIKWFTDFFGWVSKNQEICVTRVAHWYNNIDNFGVSDHSQITTKLMDEWCAQNWEKIYDHV